MEGKGYVFAICYDSDDYLPNVEYIECNDSCVPWEFSVDSAAAKGAEKERELIYGMRYVADGVYLDTPQNRR